MTGFVSNLTDGQLFMLAWAAVTALFAAVMFVFDAAVEARREREDRVLRNLRRQVRAHDNAGAALDGHPGVSTPPAEGEPMNSVTGAAIETVPCDRCDTSGEIVTGFTIRPCRRCNATGEHDAEDAA